MARSLLPLALVLLAGCATPEPPPPPEQPIRASPSTPVERQAVPSVEAGDKDTGRPAN